MAVTVEGQKMPTLNNPREMSENLKVLRENGKSWKKCYCLRYVNMYSLMISFDLECICNAVGSTDMARAVWKSHNI